MRSSILLIGIVMALILTSCASASAQSPESPTITTIENKGSDTMVNLALAWAEAYQEEHPEINISVTGGGSGTGIAALQNSTADIANASRAMKEEEAIELRTKGLEPSEYVVARDAIAVIVNPNNPVHELSLQQVSDIYSGKINNWKEVGGEDRTIVRLSRETNSGTHVYFLERVLRLGEKENQTLFSLDTLLLPSSVGIISEVRDNPNAIGYDGLGYVTDEVKMVALSEKPGEPFVLPSAETVNQALYPVARDLYMYTAGEVSPEVKEYLEWIKSTAAQAIVKELGFVTINP
jgi:phosphate transport system substrate-binding protein